MISCIVRKMRFSYLVYSSLIMLMLFFSGQIFSMTVNDKAKENVYKKNGLFYKNGKLYSGVLVNNYPSGKVEHEWSVDKGLLNGKSIGYYEKWSGNLFRIKYQYNYENGKKVGEQNEYYQKSTSLKYYENNTITDFDEMAYGNLDGNAKIVFFQKNGCGIKTDSISGKTIFPNNQICPTGQLNVFYEAHPSPGHKLFTKCYGSSKCFWRSFQKDSTWWFD